ncbi:MAG TPA: universal stress protein [Pyrinomonadaceae bacterium]|jgi:nucleotide-binding universal stress UspA family protein|nr:universal stress protein [Pyrinomonadaceae bacterium]
MKLLRIRREDEDSYRLRWVRMWQHRARRSEAPGLPAEAEVLVMSMADVFLPIIAADDNSEPPPVPDVVQRAREHAQQQLAEARDLAKRASDQIESMFRGWRVRREALADSSAWALLRTADQWKPDIIVMGARGHSVFGGRLILGSISQRVLYEAHCSVRIAHAHPESESGPVRILIGVDQSADSNAAVEAVCSRNWPKGSEVGVSSAISARAHWSVEVVRP